jgi:RNA polymerase sigma-70 factor (ECF subfamily)
MLVSDPYGEVDVANRRGGTLPAAAEPVRAHPPKPVQVHLPPPNAAPGRLPISDAELIRLIATGHAPAFAAIFARHQRTAVAVATRICGPVLAEEAVQEAFLQISRAADTYRPERGSVRNWVLSIASSRAIDAFRRNARHAGRRADAEELDQLLSADEVEATVLGRDQARTVRSLLKTLPADQARVIAMAYFDQLTHTEIAHRTGLPVGTVKGRIRLGLAKLRPPLALTAG